MDDKDKVLTYGSTRFTMQYVMQTNAYAITLGAGTELRSAVMTEEAFASNKKLPLAVFDMLRGQFTASGKLSIKESVDLHGLRNMLFNDHKKNSFVGHVSAGSIVAGSIVVTPNYTAYITAGEHYKAASVPEHGDSVEKVEWQDFWKGKTLTTSKGWSSPPQEFFEAFPCLEKTVTLPCKCGEGSNLMFAQTLLSNAIIHLNDKERWTREQIADWIEQLEADDLLDQKAVVKIGDNE